jgi:hypothetical protein
MNDIRKDFELFREQFFTEINTLNAEIEFLRQGIISYICLPHLLDAEQGTALSSDDLKLFRKLCEKLLTGYFSNNNQYDSILCQRFRKDVDLWLSGLPRYKLHYELGVMFDD